ncbi:MAG: phosphatidylglycerol lysyltransferase domain-containing protein [Deferrisomatales bacterium]|nr:phosphatidylglycerol lysyltransferase domain-containing protein [Deferrisomatales bacterium]
MAPAPWRWRPKGSRLRTYRFRHGEQFYNFQGLLAYKEKFDPVWEPRYLVTRGGPGVARALLDVAALIGGGLRAVLAK